MFDANWTKVSLVVYTLEPNISNSVFFVFFIQKHVMGKFLGSGLYKQWGQ